ncbi:MAG: zinc ABC transporter substrate-binding protein [Lacunisphaera sp.]|nr:zinc ABC transporter substrate-binding protein [Lacunisphaera sp.]
MFANLIALVLLAATAQAKLRVVATTPDLGALAQEIGGDQIELTTLAKPTEDPHFVDAKPSFIVKLNHADVLVEGGAELELGWLGPLLDGSRNGKLAAGKPGRIVAAEGIYMLEVPATLDRAQGDVHAAGNPHFMCNPANSRIVAEHIARVFSALEPASRPAFAANLKRFEARLEGKISEWRTLLAPNKGTSVVTYHNYWIYFARYFDLKMELFLEPKPGIPPTPAHLAEIITRMKDEHLKLILVQPYQNRKTAETVASHTGGIVLDFPSFPMTSEETQGYVEWMDFLVKSLVKGIEQAK